MILSLAESSGRPPSSIASTWTSAELTELAAYRRLCSTPDEEARPAESEPEKMEIESASAFRAAFAGTKVKVIDGDAN